MRRVAGPLAVLLLVSAYVLFVGPETVRQHQALETRAYDLGIMENVFWNSVNGRPFASALEGRNHLGVHFSLIYALLMPAYALWPRTETLLWAQTLLLAFAAWPLFLGARRLLESDAAAALVAALWLLHPAVAGANLWDFHELSFAPLLFFTAFHFFLARRAIPFWIAIGLLLLVKEDLALVVAGLGLWALLSGRRREGGALVAFAAAWFLVVTHLVMPRFGGGASSFGWYYEELLPRGGGPLDLLGAVLSHPGRALGVAFAPAKISYLVALFLPLAFLPLLSFRTLALVAYGLGASLLASRPQLAEVGFHYTLLTLPGAFAGAVDRLAALRRRGVRFEQAALALCALFSVVVSWRIGIAGPHEHLASGFRIVRFGLDEQARARFDEVRAVADSIPPDATVAASETLVPHVSRRRFVATVRYLDAPGPRHADYVFLLPEDANAGLLGPQGVFAGYLVERPGRFTLLLKKPAPRPG